MQTGEQARLQHFHFAGFPRLMMVIASQMQAAMHDQMRQMVTDRPACLPGFPQNGFQRQNNIAARNTGRWVKGQNIGGAVLAAMLPVENAHHAVC